MSNQDRKARKNLRDTQNALRGNRGNRGTPKQETPMSLIRGLQASFANMQNDMKNMQAAINKQAAGHQQLDVAMQNYVAVQEQHKNSINNQASTIGDIILEMDLDEPEVEVEDIAVHPVELEDEDEKEFDDLDAIVAEDEAKEARKEASIKAALEKPAIPSPAPRKAKKKKKAKKTTQADK